MQDLTPITPGKFLFGIPTVDTKDLEVQDANHFRKRLRFRAKVIEEIKRRFRNEYLGQLIQRQKQHPQSSNVHVGHIILIGDDWKKTSSMAFSSSSKIDSREGWTGENS
ncbi:integrase catalytic domain-containing protein [Trichonephila inaurata madagascariensis]|uniref:Integrase catalytic domain-containing protein n=1 Tax=Trichonephila inaurata madagascariensis TaxID=2747483 RepID=A0A8X7C2G3_9ARAC|nr:integrase catalytic domain-containing protein [Trichonephila inaurata madagascariensis]